VTLSKGVTIARAEGEAETAVSFPNLRHVMSTGWREYANCGKLPKNVFFDYNSVGLKKGEKKERISTAMNACKNCNNEPHGIWAGTFPSDRRKLFAEFKKTGSLELLTVV
jgi:hypothetical protein